MVHDGFRRCSTSHEQSVRTRQEVAANDSSLTHHSFTIDSRMFHLRVQGCANRLIYMRLTVILLTHIFVHEMTARHHDRNRSGPEFASILARPNDRALRQTLRTVHVEKQRCGECGKWPDGKSKKILIPWLNPCIERQIPTK